LPEIGKKVMKGYGKEKKTKQKKINK